MDGHPSVRLAGRLNYLRAVAVLLLPLLLSLFIAFVAWIVAGFILLRFISVLVSLSIFYQQQWLSVFSAYLAYSTFVNFLLLIHYTLVFGVAMQMLR